MTTNSRKRKLEANATIINEYVLLSKKHQTESRRLHYVSHDKIPRFNGERVQATRQWMEEQNRALDDNIENTINQLIENILINNIIKSNNIYNKIVQRKDI